IPGVVVISMSVPPMTGVSATLDQASGPALLCRSHPCPGVPCRPGTEVPHPAGVSRAEETRLSARSRVWWYLCCGCQAADAAEGCCGGQGGGALALLCCSGCCPGGA